MTHARESHCFSAHGFHTAEPFGGTLLWIGERQREEFRDAYRYCEAAASQIAFRGDLAEAISRPAAGVQSVIITRADRAPLLDEAWLILRDRYGDPPCLVLEGALCAGESLRQPRRVVPMICYAHQWRQILPDWLDQCSETPSALATPNAFNPALSLAIIASRTDSAEMLMEIADSAGVAAVWFRSPSCHQMRNFDVVWWDDSVMGQVNTLEWSDRLRPGSHSPFRRHATHVWLTNALVRQHAVAAERAGVTTVLTKPLRLDALLQTLCQTRQLESQSFTQSRVAA